MDPGIRSLVLSRLEADGSAPARGAASSSRPSKARTRSRRSSLGGAAAPRAGRGANGSGARRRLPPRRRGRGLPRHRPAADARAAAGPRPDARRRAQRLRQVELRRGARGAAHRRQPALEGARRRLARGLAQPPPSRGVAQRDVPRRGRARDRAWSRGAGSRRRRSRPAAAAAQLHGRAERRPRVARLDRGPAHASPLPLLQRAGLAARRRALEALRRALLDPRPRGPRRGAGARSRRPAARARRR